MSFKVDIRYNLKSIPSKRDLVTVENIIKDIKFAKTEILNNWMDEDTGRNKYNYPEFPLIISSIKFNKETGNLEKLEFSEGYINE